MENFINWLEVKNARGNYSSISDLGIRVYTSSKEKKIGRKQALSNAYIVFSDFLSELYEDYPYLKIGLINKKVVIKFNKEDGLRIVSVSPKSKKHTSKVGSAELCKLISTSFNLDYGDMKENFELTDLGGDTFIINSISK
jgi:hypothetical protein